MLLSSNKFQKEFNEKFDKVMNDCLDGKVDTGKINELQKLFVKSTDEFVKQPFETFLEDLKDFKYANEEAVEEKLPSMQEVFMSLITKEEVLHAE